MTKKKKKQQKLLIDFAEEFTLFAVIILLVQMLVPDWVSIGLLFNWPKIDIMILAVAGLISAFAFTIWYERKRR